MAQPIAPQVQTTKVSPETYVVLCNLPHGLTCQVGDKRVTLRGSAHYLQPNPDRKFKNPEPQDMILSATINLVDGKFWDAFVAQMNDPARFPDGYAPFKSGAILWNKNRDEVTAMRREMEKEKTGFEQGDPSAFGIQTEGAKKEAAWSSTEVMGR